MGRPSNNFCDYFSHDRDMRNHRKVKSIRNTFGISGYAIWVMTLEYLTGIDGNVIEYSDIEIELMSGDFGVSVTEIRNVIDYCIRLNLLQQEDGFVKSESLDERLKPVYDKRAKSKERSASQIRSSGKFITGSSVNAEVSVAETPQSKVNESKVNNTNTTNVVLSTSSPEHRLPKLLKDDLKDDLNEEWDALCKEISESTDLTIQKKLILKFIVVKKPQFIEPYATAWNIVASEHKFSKLQGLTYKRKNKLKTRLKEPGFDFMRIMWSIPKNPKYKGPIGENDWKVNFDYVIENDTNYFQIIEGVPNGELYDTMVKKLLGET